MPDLKFESLGNEWYNGSMFRNVEVIRVTGTGGVHVLVYTCFINIDYDGASIAYGSPGMETLESRENGGYPRYYNGGIVAVHPQARMADMDDSYENFKVGTQGAWLVKQCNLTLDLKNPDSRGRCPVFQEPGVTQGYYVSGMPYHRKFSTQCDRYKQSSYPDAAKIPFGALGGRLMDKGNVGIGDGGLAIRHNLRRHSVFGFLDAGGKKPTHPQYNGIAEFSYKVFLDLGGGKKVPGGQPFNRFAISYVVVPGVKVANEEGQASGDAIRAQLEKIGAADNAYEFPLLIAFAGMNGRGITGDGGLRQLQSSRKDRLTRVMSQLPPNYDNVVAALTANGLPNDPLLLARGRQNPDMPLLQLQR